MPGSSLTAFGKNQYMILLQASQALQSRASQMKNPDYNLILQIAQRGDELAKHTHPTLLDTMAFAQSKLGQTDNAIDSEEKAIAAAQKMQGVPESYINVLKKHLEGYKTAKG